MAHLEVLQCASCGSPLSPGALKCEYCGAQNLVKAKQNALKITSEVAKKYIAFYSEKTKENPKDANALYSIGLLYLGLKNYELAQRNFKDAIDQSPLDPDVYYYYALSLMGNKSIAKLAAKDAERMEQYLGTAIGMETKCKYLALLAVLKEGYYAANNLVVPGKAPLELYEEAKGYSPDDLDEITGNCILPESAQFRINVLAGKEKESEAGEEKNKEISEFTEEEIEAAKNLSPEQRKSYYEFANRPSHPILVDVPKGFGMGFKRILALVGSVLLCGIILSIATCSGAVMDEASIYTSTNVRLLSYINSQKASKKAMTAKEIDAKRAEYKKDSLERLINYGKYYVGNSSLIQIKTDEYNGIKTFTYIKLSFWLLVVALPLFYWIFNTGKAIYEVWSDRRDTIAHNKWKKEEYERKMRQYELRPSWEQVRVCISHFLSKVIDIELKRYYKSEENFKGLTLFIHYFNWLEDKGFKYPRVIYTIVTLEEDCISVIRNDWNLLEDTVGKNGSIEQVSYGDIGNISVSGNKIRLGEVEFSRDYEDQDFEYQDKSKTDALKPYSATRTSDLQKFAAGLRKLVQDYKNQRSR